MNEKFLEKYEVIQKLQKEWQIRQKGTHQRYILRILSFGSNGQHAKQIYKQIMYQETLSHPIILKIKKITRVSKQQVYFLYEYLEQKLSYVMQHRILLQIHVRYISYKIALALYFLHSAQLIHGNLKQNNIYINPDITVKLSNFSKMQSSDDEVSPQTDLNEDMVPYEKIEGFRTKQTDIWYFGQLLGSMLRRETLFPGDIYEQKIDQIISWTKEELSEEDLLQLKSRVSKQKFQNIKIIEKRNRDEIIPDCPEDAMDLLSKILVYNPQKRITILEVVKHPYYSQFYRDNDLVISQEKVQLFDHSKKVSTQSYMHEIDKFIKQHYPNEFYDEMKSTKQENPQQYLQDKQKQENINTQ